MVNAIMKIPNHKSHFPMPSTPRRLVVITKHLSAHLKYVMMVNVIMRMILIIIPSSPKKNQQIATTRPPNAL